jgi:hypothetical protein
MRCARGGGDIGQNGTRSRKQGSAGWQKAYTTRGSREQLHTELVLERVHLATERRLRHVEASCGSTHIALLRDDDEILQLRETHYSDPSTQTWHHGQIKKVLDRGRGAPAK